MFSLQKWNEDYNITGNDVNKLIDVANEIISQTKSSSKIRFELPETEQPQKVKIDISKIRKLGYNPKIKVKKKEFLNVYEINQLNIFYILLF